MKMKFHGAAVTVSLILALTLALSGCGQGAAAPESAPAAESSKTEESASQQESVSSEESVPESESESAAEESEPAIVITDMLGREVVLDEPAERVVALTAADCEMLYAIGAGDLLVGRGEWCDYPPEVFEIPAVQSGSETDIEQIIALDPQVLLMASMGQTEEQVNALEEAGIRVVVSDAQDIAGTYQALRMLGALTGHEQEAEDVISGMQETFDTISANRIPDGGSIYFEVSPLEYGLWAAGPGSFMNEVAEMMGLTNIFADAPSSWAEVSPEEVIARNPDYIVTITMYYGEGPTPEEEICSREGWDVITAVRENRILNLPNNELSRPGPRLADGARMLYDFVTGEGSVQNAA